MARPRDVTPASLSGRVLRAGLWVVGASMGGRLLAAVRVLVLARLLTPHDFGLVAVALLPLSAFAAIGAAGWRRRGNLSRRRGHAW